MSSVGGLSVCRVTGGSPSYMGAIGRSTEEGSRAVILATSLLGSTSAAMGISTT